ncbi:MAG: right-handed parallel beta-helix repeat-containing protein, partial [Lentisphaeria bacterium]|nr:right-handed parallel beta-helix repeat-containing protein [Lentisphaeria bacterium]
MLIFAAAASFLALLSVAPTYSDTITVHQTGGGDHTTINDAMAAANPNVDVVEIIDTATYSESIVATSGVDLTSNALPQPIIISASLALPALTLNGSNVSGITFSSSGKHLGGRAFVGALEITPNVGTSTISDCTFTSNACGVMVDNAAYASGDLVTITDCVFIDNLVGTLLSESSGHNVVITQSVFDSNGDSGAWTSAPVNGACMLIAAFDSCEVSDSLFTNNETVQFPFAGFNAGSCIVGATFGGLEGQFLTIDNITVESNNEDAAISLTDNVRYTLKNSLLQANVELNGQGAMLREGSISDNTFDGADLIAFGPVEALLIGNVIVNGQYSFAGVDSKLAVVNDTFVNNDKNGIEPPESAIEFLSTSIFGTTPTNSPMITNVIFSGYACGLQRATGSDGYTTNSSFWQVDTPICGVSTEDIISTNMTDQDPDFWDPGTGDYHLGCNASN